MKSDLGLLLLKANEAAKAGQPFTMGGQEALDLLVDLSEHHAFADQVAVMVGIEPMDAPHCSELAVLLQARLEKGHV